VGASAQVAVDNDYVNCDVNAEVNNDEDNDDDSNASYRFTTMKNARLEGTKT
jgi:hypothetical protein